MTVTNSKVNKNTATTGGGIYNGSPRHAQSHELDREQEHRDQGRKRHLQHRHAHTHRQPITQPPTPAHPHSLEGPPRRAFLPPAAELPLGALQAERADLGRVVRLRAKEQRPPALRVLIGRPPALGAQEGTGLTLSRSGFTAQ